MLGMHVSKAFLAWSGFFLAPLAGSFRLHPYLRGYVPLWPEEILAALAALAAMDKYLLLLAVLLPHTSTNTTATVPVHYSTALLLRYGRYTTLVGMPAQAENRETMDAFFISPTRESQK